MTSPFDYSGPSQLAKALKPHPGNRPGKPITLAGSLHGGAYSRARAGDPETSHAAAERAEAFAGTHADRILAALKKFGAGTPEYISAKTGLTVVQIDRRLVEMQRKGLIRVVQVFGVDLIVGGYRCWEPV